jgi:hypothetical protein
VCDGVVVCKMFIGRRQNGDDLLEHNVSVYFPWPPLEAELSTSSFFLFASAMKVYFLEIKVLYLFCLNIRLFLGTACSHGHY